jgi:hypothetical protein
MATNIESTTSGRTVYVAGTARRAFDRLTGESLDPSRRAEHAEHVRETGAVTLSVTHLSATDGLLYIEWCDDCSWRRVFCEHRDCTWSQSCTVLTCDVCGEDLS